MTEIQKPISLRPTSKFLEATPPTFSSSDHLSKDPNIPTYPRSSSGAAIGDEAVLFSILCWLILRSASNEEWLKSHRCNLRYLDSQRFIFPTEDMKQ